MQFIQPLSQANQEAFQTYINHLTLKGYSPSTIRTYKNEFRQLLKLLGKVPVNTLNPDQLKRYMIHTLEKEGISENTAHSRLNALKFYFEQVLGQEKFFHPIPRPKKPLLLPKVLGEEELSRLFRSLTNSKHKAMLFTAYSAGLRVSEIANLKIKDIDSDRMQIFIEKAKGKKDRYVPTARSYWNSFDPILKQPYPALPYSFSNPSKPEPSILHGQFNEFFN